MTSRSKNIYNDKIITTKVMIGRYKESAHTPKEIVGKRYITFCARKEKITHIAKDIVKISGRGYGRITKSWEHAEHKHNRSCRVLIEILG